MLCKLIRDGETVDTFEITGYTHENNYLILENLAQNETEKEDLAITSENMIFYLSDTIHLQDSLQPIDEYIAKMRFERKIDEASFFDAIEIYDNSKLAFELKTSPETRKSLIQKFQKEFEEDFIKRKKKQNGTCLCCLIFIGVLIILFYFEMQNR